MKFQQFCTLCQPEPLITHMTGALTEKYSTSINFHHLQQMETFIQDMPHPLNIVYRQSLALSDDNQYLKRIYTIQQFPNKISQLGQYYKFSRDLPRCVDSNLSHTIQKYHDRLRQLDFKKVKAAVKKQQGISLSSYRQDSSFPNSQCQLKSRYSSVLHNLNDSQNQSNLLNGICQQIEEALPDSHQASAFKGYFPEGTKQFQNFLEKEAKKKDAFNKKKRQSSQRLLRYDNKENTMKNRLNLIRNRSKKSIHKNYNEKTRANDTLQRQQKIKKDKLMLKTIDHQINFKPLASALLKPRLPKNLEQIYKGTGTHQAKYHSNKEKKVTDKIQKKTFGHSAKISTHTRNNSKQNYVPETDRQQRYNSKKSIFRTSVNKSVEKSKRQPSQQSYKALPLAIKSKEKRQRTLSRSKSKSRLSKQPSRQALKVRSQTFHQTSNMSANKKRQENSKQKTRDERQNIERLLHKKLALFMH